MVLIANRYNRCLKHDSKTCCIHERTALRPLGINDTPHMLATINSAALFGIDAIPVSVEVDVANGLPSFTTVGLPDSSVRESKDRVKAAIKNCGYEFPGRKITVNLAPADLKKGRAVFRSAHRSWLAGNHRHYRTWRAQRLPGGGRTVTGRHPAAGLRAYCPSP